MKTIDVDKLKETKVTLPLIMVVGLVVLGFKADNLTVDYLGEFFITKAEASEQYEQVSKQVEKNTELIATHVNEYKLNENANRIARIESQLFDLEFHVEQNGETELTRDRERALRAELARLGRIRACIVRNQHRSDDEAVENCDAIL